MVGTPGPANLMAMLAGVTQGLRGCVGFIFGMAVGKVGLNLFIGFGFGVILENSQILQTALTYGSAGFMIWLAIKSWPRSVNYKESWRYKTDLKFRFRDGVILHPLNPKAWMMVIIAWGHFAPSLGEFSVQLPIIIFCFAACQLIFHSLWCALGVFLSRSFVYNQLLARVMIILTILVVLVSLVYTPSVE